MASNSTEFKFRFTGDLRDLQKQLQELGRDLGSAKKQGADVAAGMQTGVNGVKNAVDLARANIKGLEGDLKRAQAAAAKTAADTASAPTRPKGDPGGAIAKQQIADRDEALRILEINRRADALEQRLAATRVRGAAASRTAATATAQQAAATRDLNRQIQLAAPQLTDIGVSLASGQSPFLVAIQQGGQLRDVFGSFGGALRGVGAALGAIITPATLVVGAIALLGVGFVKGQDEGLRFARIIETTGGAAGVTSGQLDDMASSLDRLDGSTRASAADTLAQIAESGKFTADQFNLVATASEKMRNATGRDVQATIAEFEKLADSPADAVVELNQKYNFLTGSILEQIRVLQDQGREQEAATLAMQAYANAVDQRTPGIQANLGLIQRGWKAITTAAREAGDALLDVGRQETGREEFDRLFQLRQQNLENARLGNKFAQDVVAGAEARMRALQDAEVKAQQDANRQRAQRTAVSLSAELQNEAKQYESKEQKRARTRIAAINRANAAIEAATIAGDAKAADAAKAARAQIIAGLDKEEAEEAERRAKASARTGAAAAKRSAEARRQAAALVQIDAQLVVDATTRALAELDRLYAEGQVKTADYYAERTALQLQAIDAEIKAAEAQRDASTEIDERKRAEADLIRLSRERAEIGPKAAREQAAAERELNQELDRLRARLADATGSIGEGDRVRLEQEREALLQRFGSDPRAQDLVKSLFDVELARSRSEAIASEGDRMIGLLATRSQFLASQVQIGAITQTQAEQQIRVEREATIRQLEELLLKAQAALNAQPSPETLAAVDQLKTKINELKAAEQTLGDAAAQAGMTALRGLFTDLASGAVSFEEAMKRAVLSFVQGMAEMAAAALAQKAIEGVMSLFGGGQQSAGPDIAQSAAAGAAYAAPVSAAAVALTTAATTGAAAFQTAAVTLPTGISTAATALSVSGGIVTTGAFALQTAAVQLQAAATTLLIANSVGSASGVAHSGAKIGAGFPAYRKVHPAVFIGAPRFHSGSGGPIGLKQDEVPAILQTGERVLNRKETIAYERAQRGAAGGDATRVVNVFDSAFVPDQMDSAAGEQVILNVIGRNPGRVRQILG
jgi:hypothetical protein